MGNPFLEESDDLFAIDTKNVCSSDVVTTVQTVEVLGQEQFKSFVSERLINRTKPVTDHMPRNKLALFNQPSLPKKASGTNKLAAIRND